jgi:PHD/YefM family antitoxin component YafN of YafNO toxin-antitoxin module
VKDFPSGSLQRQSGVIQDKALVEPIGITRNGRRRLVMLSVEEYERLKRRDREVMRTEDLPEAEIARVAASEPPAEAAAFDDEVTDDTA